MSSKNNEIRCKHCGALLAKFDETGLTIRRGNLQASIDGDFRAALVCYRPHCGELNVLRLSTAAGAGRAAP